MKVSVTRTIDAAHQLPDTQLHGHTYRVTAMIAGPLGDTGYVYAFETLQAGLSTICSALSHTRLETLIGSPATAERLAVHIARAVSKHAGRIVNVRVAVGDSGSVETDLYVRDGEYFTA